MAAYLRISPQKLLRSLRVYTLFDDEVATSFNPATLCVLSCDFYGLKWYDVNYNINHNEILVLRF